MNRSAERSGAVSETTKLGTYEFLHDLASGGMGSVHVARQAGAAGFERLVVIKRVHRHLLQDREFRERFQREARISAAIRHPNVVSVIDVVDNGEELFLVLEYVESVSLAELVLAAKNRSTRLPKNVASRILCDALAGLHAAHEVVDLRGEKLGLIHRDVSPHNIIVGVDGTSRIIDFGVAKATAYASATRTGQVLGKLSYMSPEQVKRLELDRRADVFAAGVTLFEALTSKRLFRGEDEGDILIGILAGEAPSLRGEWGDANEDELEAVVAKALERDRDERFQTAEELRDALERAAPPATAREVASIVLEYGEERLSERRVAITRQVTGAPSQPTSIAAPATNDLATEPMPLATATDLDASPSPPRRAPAKNRAALVVVSLSVASVLAVGGYLGARGPQPNAPAGTTSVTASAASGATSVAGPVASTPRESSPAPPPAPPAPTPSSTPTATATAIPPPRRPWRPVVRPSPSNDLHKSPY